MQPYQQRVVTEKAELDIKLNALRLFLETRAFGDIDEKERQRMVRQQKAMSDYSAVLGQRIEAFK